MPAPRHDPVGLAARIRSTIAEIDALDAQARVIATKRAARDADVRRMTWQLARIPADESDAPVHRASECIPIKQAARIAKRSVYTLRRRGKPGGWAWKAGGRWVVDAVGLDDWMRGM